MAPESSHSKPNGFLGFLGIFVLLFAVAIVAVAILGFSGNNREGLEQRRAAARIAVRTKLDTEAQDKLNSEGWIDKAKGLVHVSINDAIPLAVTELRGKKPAPSQVKVEPPLPMPVIDPNSTEPPPPALPSSPQGADTIRFAALATPEPAAAVAPAAAPAATPAPAAAPAPAPAKAPEPAPAPAPAPAAPVPAPAQAPAPAAPEAKPAPAPAPVEAAPAPAPAAAPEAPARPPIINPTENPAPTK